MFTRKGDENGAGTIPGSAPQSAQSTPTGPSVTSSPAPSGPTRKPSDSSGMKETIISSDLTIIGNVTSNGNVKLDGTIQGDMYCSSLVVSENGEIKGGIVANDVVVLGKVNGSIRGRRVMLHSSAHVEGDIFHQGIGIEMGTRYDGTLKWTDDPKAFVPGAGKTSTMASS